jgi:hypothetical protein
MEAVTEISSIRRNAYGDTGVMRNLDLLCIQIGE